MSHRVRIQKRCVRFGEMNQQQHKTTKRKNEHLIDFKHDFSKYSITIPIKKTKSKTIINILLINVFTVFSYPEAIRLNNASYFSSNEFNIFTCNLGTHLIKSTAYNHDSNDEVERFNRTINEMLTCYKIGYD
uniref:Integrase catalytic domain-containing protein n=1 Tax=Strongyloides papillosus TaxID=174720 RepID=A0A0N5BGG1_STREA